MSSVFRTPERERRFVDPIPAPIEQYLQAAIERLDQIQYGDPSVFLRKFGRRNDVSPASLREIWTPPTFRRSEQRGDEVTIAEMLCEERLAVVVLADPGHGKSTAGRFLMCDLADRFLRRKSAAFAIFVPLRRLDSLVGDHKQAIARAAATEVGLGNHATIVDALAAHADDALLIFDGLDELPVEAVHTHQGEARVDRQTAVRLIRARLTRKPLADPDCPVKIIVTSRRLDYLEEDESRISGAVPYFLPAFLPEHVAPAIRRWHQVAAELADRFEVEGVPDLPARGEAIIQHLRMNQDLAEVCTAPMMLTLLQTVFADTGDLPSSVSQLCDRAISSLLIEKHDTGIASTHADVLLKVINEAGFAIHQTIVQSGESSLDQHALREIIRSALSSQPTPPPARRIEELCSQVMVHLMGGHGVLVWQASDNSCEFTHNVLREVMAGVALSARTHSERRALALDERWGAPLRYWAGVQAAGPGGLSEITTFLGELSVGPKSRSIEASLARAEILSEAVAVSPLEHVPALLQRGVTATAAELVRLIGRPDLAFYRRARCGEMLALLGDTRLTPSILERLVTVSGCDGARLGRVDPHGYNNEAKGDRVPASPAVVGRLETFAVAAFETTNTEFLKFIDDGGYGTRDYWPSEVAWRWAKADEEQLRELLSLAGHEGVHFETEIMGERILIDEIPSLVERMIVRRRPMYWSHPAYNGPNQPVVGVNWWEAFAYCQWLTERLRQDGRLSASEEVSLPTEAEWEWTARATGSDRHPWLEGSLLDNAHVRDAADRTSYDRALAVGMYPFVKTSLPIFDLVGNVWEWTATKVTGPVSMYGPNSFVQTADPSGLEERIARGTSWFSSEPESAEITFRSFDPPFNAYEDLGFRIVLRTVR